MEDFIRYITNLTAIDPAGALKRLYCFLFQAEDGMRAFHVTGVQTCALPISGSFTRVLHPRLGRHGHPPSDVIPVGRSVIGRASCRERVEISVVAVSFNK